MPRFASGGDTNGTVTVQMLRNRDITREEDLQQSAHGDDWERKHREAALEEEREIREEREKERYERDEKERELRREKRREEDRG